MCAASPFVAEVMRRRYGRVTPIMPCAIDTEQFRPTEDVMSDTVLLVGNASLRFKGLDVAMKALAQVWDMGLRFRVRWITQVEPYRLNVPWPMEVVVNPNQDDIPRLYRESAVLLFTSWYEGFGLPPLEAMASGVPVITTDCGGVNSFVRPGGNALVADPGDIDSLAAGVAYLLGNPQARRLLARCGRETAVEFSWDRVLPLVEEILTHVVDNWDIVFD